MNLPAVLRLPLAGILILASLAACKPAAGECPPRPDDSTGYLVSICRYIRDKHLDVSPANPAAYNIKRIEARKDGEKDVVWVFLDCCYLGDIAVIDPADGTVLSFRAGAK